MINNVVLVGRMTRDAELRYTPSNQAVATFSLAVNRNFKNQSGEREADFINCVIWRQQAENRATREGGSPNSYNNGGYNNAPSNNSYSASSQQTPNFSRDESPFGNSNPMDISDDDLPF
ncbi:MAG: single-stranded DNA-binding protein [Streptococcus agalactiae]|nr:single-stranded DNA-binding protein [Streptococcus agalactiae]